MVAKKSSSIPVVLFAAIFPPTLAALAAPPPTEAQPDFCASLARVIAAARTEFETIHGKPRENGGWDATEVLSGLHDCEIEKNGTYYDAPLYNYRCDFSKHRDAAAANADQENLRRQISRCLGESWKIGESEKDPERYSPDPRRPAGASFA